MNIKKMLLFAGLLLTIKSDAVLFINEIGQLLRIQHDGKEIVGGLSSCKKVDIDKKFANKIVDIDLKQTEEYQEYMSIKLEDISNDAIYIFTKIGMVSVSGKQLGIEAKEENKSRILAKALRMLQ